MSSSSESERATVGLGTSHAAHSVSVHSSFMDEEGGESRPFSKVGESGRQWCYQNVGPAQGQGHKCPHKHGLVRQPCWPAGLVFHPGRQFRRFKKRGSV